MLNEFEKAVKGFLEIDDFVAAHGWGAEMDDGQIVDEKFDFAKSRIESMLSEAEERPHRVWVLIRRYEWEAQSNETEFCEVTVHPSRASAIIKAGDLLKSDLENYSYGEPEDVESELRLLGEALVHPEFPRYCVALTDGDSVVYELYGKPVEGE